MAKMGSKIVAKITNPAITLSHAENNILTLSMMVKKSRPATMKMTES